MKCWQAIGHPFSMWVLYLLIFSFIAIIGAPEIAYLFFVGSGSIVLALSFGFWTGLKSSKLFQKPLAPAILNGFILGISIGFISLLLELGVALLSPGFMSTMAPNIVGMLPISLGSWAILTMLSSLGSAIGSEFKR
ncbi:MAG: hypothetical protein ACP5P2_01505 [Candidatus Micrarchaeia archaeon]|jgi:hypothetical protein